MTDSSILRDLAAVAAVAAAAAVAAPRLRLPALPAYLLAGIALGAVRSVSPDVLGDLEAVGALSNLGVTFLMFSIGLEFDIAKTRALFAPAALAVVAQMIAMFALGGAVAAASELGGREALFLGGLFSISSTMVSVSTLQAGGHLARNYGRLTVGVLVLEDIAAVALLAILAGLGATASPHGGSGHGGVVATLFFVGAFMTLLLAGGRLLLRRWLPALNAEKQPGTLPVIVAGLVLGVGLLAERFDYSPALGAFVLGAALAQSRMAKPVGDVAEPLRDIFSAVFFVTLGVTVSPSALLAALPVALPAAALLIVGKTGACWFGAALGGQKPASALRMALNKAHIGEFSFVIAALGERAGVTGPGVTAIAADCALLSILAHRPLTNRTEDIIRALERRMPAALRQTADFYGNLLATAAGRFDRAMLWRLLRKPLAKCLMHLVFFFSLVGVAHLTCRHIADRGDEDSRITFAVWAGAAIGSLPFAVALTRNLEAVVMIVAETALPHRIAGAKGVRRLGIVTGIIQSLVVGLLSLGTLAFATPWLPGTAGSLPLLGVVVCGAWLFRHALARAQNRFEVLFIESFNKAAREDEAGRRTGELQRMVRRHRWPLHLREHRVEPGTRAAGVKLADLDLRSGAGVFITSMRRAGITIFAPAPETVICPEDEVMLLGTKEQLDAATALLAEASDHAPEGEQGFLMDQVFVAHDSPVAGETLAGGRLRHTYGVTVAGVQRGDTQHLSPGPDFLVKSGDILLVAGRVEDVLRFKKAAAGGLADISD